MAKILGLDLGTNSIGWAIVDSETNKLINCGARIFPIDKQQKRSWKLRRGYRDKFIELMFPKSRYYIVLTSLIILTILTFTLSISNVQNWQFWLNISLTALFSTLTIIVSQDKK